MAEHFLAPGIDAASLKELSAAQRDQMAAMRELQGTIKQVADEAPAKAKDVIDHSALTTAGLLLLYFILQGAIAYVKSILDQRNQGPKT